MIQGLYIVVGPQVMFLTVNGQRDTETPVLTLFSQPLHMIVFMKLVQKTVVYKHI